MRRDVPMSFNTSHDDDPLYRLFINTSAYLVSTQWSQLMVSGPAGLGGAPAPQTVTEEYRLVNGHVTALLHSEEEYFVLATGRNGECVTHTNVQVSMPHHPCAVCATFSV